MAENGGRLITVAAAARILSLNPQTVYRQLLRGKLPGYRIAWSWRLDPEEIKLFARRKADRAAQRRAARTRDAEGNK